MAESVRMKSLIVFSHLRWNFVFQRPQHLLSRLSKRYRIYFFEEPIPGAERNFLEISEPSPNVVSQARNMGDWFCWPWTRSADPIPAPVARFKRLNTRPAELM